jgi:hypothetical protein
MVVGGTVVGGTVVGGTVVGGAVVGGTVVAGGLVVVVTGCAVVVVDEREVVVVEWPAAAFGFVPPVLLHDAVPMAMTNSPRMVATISRTCFFRALAGRSTDICPPLVVSTLSA